MGSDFRGIIHGFHPRVVPTTSLSGSSVTFSLTGIPMPVVMAWEARKSAFVLKHLKQLCPGLVVKWEHFESLKGLFSQPLSAHLGYTLSLSYNLSESFRKGFFNFISFPDNLFLFKNKEVWCRPFTFLGQLSIVSNQSLQAPWQFLRVLYLQLNKMWKSFHYSFCNAWHNWTKESKRVNSFRNVTEFIQNVWDWR